MKRISQETLVWLLEGFALAETALSGDLSAPVRGNEVYHISGRDVEVPQRWKTEIPDHEVSLFDAVWEEKESPIIFGPIVDSGPFPCLKPGMRVDLPRSGHKLEIVALVGQGHRAKVYRVSDLADGQVYALKVIHEPTDINLLSIAREALKEHVLAENEIPGARVIEAGRDYVLKAWVEGTLGDVWIQRELNAAGRLVDLRGAMALLEFYHHASVQRVSIENLKPANMMLDSDCRWVPIDPGRITVGLSAREALSRYRSSFIRKWLGVKPYSIWYGLANCRQVIRRYAGRGWKSANAKEIFREDLDFGRPFAQPDSNCGEHLRDRQ